LYFLVPSLFVVLPPPLSLSLEPAMPRRPPPPQPLSFFLERAVPPSNDKHAVPRRPPPPQPLSLSLEPAMTPSNVKRAVPRRPPPPPRLSLSLFPPSVRRRQTRPRPRERIAAATRIGTSCLLFHTRLLAWSFTTKHHVSALARLCSYRASAHANHERQ